jgi:hypothetical protein
MSGRCGRSLVRQRGAPFYEVRLQLLQAGARRANLLRIKQTQLSCNLLPEEIGPVFGTVQPIFETGRA